MRSLIVGILELQNRFFFSRLKPQVDAGLRHALENISPARGHVQDGLAERKRLSLQPSLVGLLLFGRLQTWSTQVGGLGAPGRAAFLGLIALGSKAGLTLVTQQGISLEAASF